MAVSSLGEFLASNGDLIVGMLFVAVVIAVTLVMTAASDRPQEPRRGTDR
jgi:nitrogen fixation protein FixH